MASILLQNGRGVCMSCSAMPSKGILFLKDQLFLLSPRFPIRVSLVSVSTSYASCDSTYVPYLYIQPFSAGHSSDRFLGEGY